MLFIGIQGVCEAQLAILLLCTLPRVGFAGLRQTRLMRPVTGLFHSVAGPKPALGSRDLLTIGTMTANDAMMFVSSCNPSITQ